MPSCYVGKSCKAPSLPLENRLACALCESKLHRICRYFYQEDSIQFQNVCGLCLTAMKRKNDDLDMPSLPFLPHCLVAQQVRETDLVPQIKKHVLSTTELFLHSNCSTRLALGTHELQQHQKM